ncbi:MAG: MarR family transcriptional regulator [Bryobacteraceae bacterium]
MSGKLQAEIRQSKPFGSIEEEAILNLAKTADLLEQRIEAVLKPFGISQTQYNVLRILRGAGKDGLSCRQIGERMISHDPDITRLIDRMEKPGLVSRSRETSDRRVVVVRITDAGLKLVKQLDEPLEKSLKESIGHVGRGKLESLIEVLELIRT